jgi:hypothetical protein
LPLKLIIGPPGVGKSVEVLTYALHIFQEKSVVYIHSDKTNLIVFYGTGNICHQFIGTPNSDDMKCVSDWLRTKVTSDDYVFVDGTNKEFIDSVYTTCSKVLSKLYVCTSFQAMKHSDENRDIYASCTFVVPSWTKEEYMEAITKNCLSISMNELEEKYYFAGGCIRRMSYPINEIIKRIDTDIKRVSDVSILLRGYIGDSSQDQVNSLMNVVMKSDTDYETTVTDYETSVVSQYALRSVVSKCTPEFISSARLVMVQNPIWQGWVTEFECLYKIQKCSGNLELWDENGTSVTWPKNGVNVVTYGSINELNKYSHDNKFFIPKRYNEPTTDAIYITTTTEQLKYDQIENVKVLRFLQITDSTDPHKLDLKVVLNYATSVGAYIVDFVILD